MSFIAMYRICNETFCGEPNKARVVGVQMMTFLIVRGSLALDSFFTSQGTAYIRGRVDETVRAVCASGLWKHIKLVCMYIEGKTCMYCSQRLTF